MKHNTARYLVCCALGLFFTSCPTLTSAADGPPTDWVSPFIGTGGHGHTHPAATRPFGMVQVGPDTRLTGWDGCSGYHYSDETIYGFTHTHLSGTGISDYGDILLMPLSGALRLERGEPGAPDSGYNSRFRHAAEAARPGYYRVHLDDEDILVELTATRRCGLHRFTGSATSPAHVVLDLIHRDPVTEAWLRVVNDHQVAGYRRSGSWARDQRVYFVARFSRPFVSHGLVRDGVRQTGATDTEGNALQAWFSFDGNADEPLLVKVGLSAVDMAGAQANLDAEIPGWDFDAVRQAAENEWTAQLGKISIRGGSPAQRTIFTTALYHACLNPTLFTDVDGRYRGRDMAIHHAADFENYTLFSLWDTFRAAHPLLTLLEPQRTNHFIRTFLAQFRQGGALPVWELWANETHTMIGYHAVPVIVDAWVKGVRDFDTDEAFRAMTHSAGLDHFGLRAYRELGYIPVSEDAESVSKTLEYAYDDWCIAEMARRTDRPAEYRHYLQRAQSYKNVFDPGTGFMRGRVNGGWFSPFDPREVNFNYTEANAWQYSFFVPQDITGLIALLGGDRAFTAKLDELFSAPSDTTGREQADITGLIGQYAHGNEPSHHMAYLYDYAGQPWKTQAMVRRIMDELYTAAPDGLCGNEDAGQMSAWYVFSALGFYPVTPGSDIYAMGTPLFPEAAIHLPDGNTFTIRAPGVSAGNIYIQSVTLNGRPWTKSYLRHADLIAGGELVFRMGPEPNRAWASEPADRPRAAIDEHRIQPVPFVVAGDRTFTSTTTVTLGVLDGAAIHYTLDGSVPRAASPRYTRPLVLRDSTTLRARAMTPAQPPSGVITARFDRISGRRRIELQTEFAPQYSAGGPTALIDTIRGGPNFRTGAWQGYEAADILAVVDLGETRAVRRVAVGFLQDIDSWIFMPEALAVDVSADGEIFRNVGRFVNDVPQREETVVIKDFTVTMDETDVRFVRIRAHTPGTCPAWHKGAGGKAWIFADEIVIE